MSDQNYTTTFEVDQSPAEVFAAINNVRAWWSEEIDGNTDKLGSVYYYHFKDIHRCTIKVTDLVLNKKVAWRVLHNDFNFIKDKTEWNDTDIVFEIEKKGDQTKLRFTHVGLAPSHECYEVCSDAWGTYINGSLRELITTGKGHPNQNVEIAGKHDLL
ncbi:MAG: SRPBCC domain-containing protein [Chloroflexi bacterium]|nr:SRPBCC domain-containing protein [Chloroflexota bacterium]